MSKIDVKLSDLTTDDGGHWGIFHDLRYSNDRYGGNQNEMKLEIKNVSGNGIDVQIAHHSQDPRTGKWQYKWKNLEDLDGVRIKIRGSIENSEFLKMLQLILETEKIVEIVKP